MAKRKKGYQELARYQKARGNSDQYVVDFKQYADEFSKMLGKSYHFLLENGQKMCLKFEEGNFYHMLGFHKFSRTVFSQMVAQDAYEYGAADFYNDVVDERIKFDWWNEEKVSVPQNLLRAGYCRNFSEQKEDGDAKNVINRRFPYFTYDNMVKMFTNKVVIDHDNSQSKSDVRADKIFFVYLDDTDRNLNFGVDFDQDGYFPTTFFLEDTKNWFMYKKNGEPSDVLGILGLYIECGKRRETELFYVNWKGVRKKFMAEHGRDSYLDMKKAFNKENVTSYYIKKQKKELEERVLVLNAEIDAIKEKITICELKLSYLRNPSDEATILNLMDWNIDIENEYTVGTEVQEQKKKLCKELDDKSQLCKRHERKIRKIEVALLDIRQLDKLMVLEIYNAYIYSSKFWKDSFWDYLIEEIDWTEMNLDPKKMKDLYKAWRNRQHCLCR